VTADCCVLLVSSCGTEECAVRRHCLQAFHTSLLFVDAPSCTASPTKLQQRCPMGGINISALRTRTVCTNACLAWIAGLRLHSLIEGKPAVFYRVVASLLCPTHPACFARAVPSSMRGCARFPARAGPGVPQPSAAQSGHNLSYVVICRCLRSSSVANHRRFDTVESAGALETCPSEIPNLPGFQPAFYWHSKATGQRRCWPHRRTCQPASLLGGSQPLGSCTLCREGSTPPRGDSGLASTCCASLLSNNQESILSASVSLPDCWQLPGNKSSA